MNPQAGSTPEEIWMLAYHRVKRAVDVPTVWMAMEAARPLALDGNHLVVGMAPDDQYLRVNLQIHEYATAIDDALAAAAGRPLALHIVEGFSLDEYRAGQAETAARAASPSPPDIAMRGEIFEDEPAAELERVSPASAPRAALPPPSRAAEEVVESIASWDKLNERLTVAFKRAPLARYPHGQAVYLLHAVKLISATMDHFMDAPFGQADPIQERALAKCVERLGVTIGLDPFFISLELVRYRYEHGKDIGVFPAHLT